MLRRNTWMKIQVFFFIRILVRFILLLVSKSIPKILKITILFVILLISRLSFSQFQVLGAENAGVAFTQVAKSSFSSFYSNPAGIGYFKSNHFGLIFQQTVPVQGFATIGMLGNFCFPKFNVSLGVDNFGDKIYHESRAGLAVAKKLDRVSMGLKVSYLNVGIQDFSSKGAILGEFGIMAYLNKYFTAGMHVYNFTRAEVFNQRNLDTKISTGLYFKPFEKLNFTVQSDYFLTKKIFVRAGLTYKPNQNFEFNTGVNPALGAVHLGSQLMIKKYKLMYAAAFSNRLGMSNDFSLVIDINPKSK